MKPVSKSAKLANVGYDIRGPVLDRAREMEEEGQKILKLNIGNLAVFGLVHSVKSGSYDYVAADSLDKWARVVSLYAALKAHPLVAAEFPAK